MELLVASAIGVMTAAGIYLILRARAFPVVVGMTMLSYAVNTFLFVIGGLAINQPPIIRDGVSSYTDPLPQALVLTAIVISFGMTAVIVILALRAYLESGNEEVDTRDDDGVEGDA
jgi:multicomponent K+:H+ antiporter subunit C